MADIRKTTEIDRSYNGALREIHRLCGVLQNFERDNKFLTEQLLAVAKERSVLREQLEAVVRERNALRRSYFLLTEEMLEKETKPA